MLRLGPAGSTLTFKYILEIACLSMNTAGNDALVGFTQMDDDNGDVDDVEYDELVFAQYTCTNTELYTSAGTQIVGTKRFKLK